MFCVTYLFCVHYPFKYTQAAAFITSYRNHTRTHIPANAHWCCITAVIMKKQLSLGELTPLLPSVTGRVPASLSCGDEEEPVPTVTGCQQQYMTHPIFWDWRCASSHPPLNKQASSRHWGDVSQRERNGLVLYQISKMRTQLYEERKKKQWKKKQSMKS